MNTANLQLEGLYLAMAAIAKALVRKGALTEEEIDRALRTAEAVALSDDRSVEDLSPANRDAVVFPIRLLRLANQAPTDEIPDFYTLAKRVGETKPPHNDQL